MNKLNFWNSTWPLDEAQCPCDIHFLEYLESRDARGVTIFHFGTGNHHIVGLRLDEAKRNCAVLGITASPQEYEDYIKLLIDNPTLGHTYKAYFGDIYQLDTRLLPQFDYVTLFHVGEFRSEDNDRYDDGSFHAGRAAHGVYHHCTHADCQEWKQRRGIPRRLRLHQSIRCL